MKNSKEARYIAAKSAAKKFFDCDYVIADLDKGDVFRFPRLKDLFVYGGRGWYKPTENAKRSHRVGIFTAVEKVTDGNSNTSKNV